MIEQLFGSKTRVKLLHLFYSNPNRSFYVREITRKIDEQINSVRRELANLLSIGIITSDNNNNKLYYEVSQTYEYYDPLELIFGAGKTSSKPKAKSAAIATDEEQADLKHLGNVEMALFTGSFTRDETASIDVLIVGNVNQTQLTKYIEALEKKEGRDIRYAVLSLDEYKYREQIHDRFVAQIQAAKKQILIDKAHLLSEK